MLDRDRHILTMNESVSEMKVEETGFNSFSVGQITP